MTKRIDWAEEHDGKQLWEIARDWKEKGMTWGEVAETLGDEYGIEVTENGTSAAVHYRQTVAAERQAEPKRAEGAQTPAPPAGEEAPAPAPEAPPVVTETTVVSLEARYADDPAYQLAGVELAAGEAAWAWEAGDRDLAFELLDEMRDALRRATVLMRRQEVA